MSWPFTRRPEISRAEVWGLIMTQLGFWSLLVLPTQSGRPPLLLEMASEFPDEIYRTVWRISGAMRTGQYLEGFGEALILLIYILILMGGLLVLGQILWFWTRRSWRVFLWDAAAAYGLIGLGVLLTLISLHGWPPSSIERFIVHQMGLYGLLVLVALFFGHLGPILFRPARPKPRPDA